MGAGEQRDMNLQIAFELLQKRNRNKERKEFGNGCASQGIDSK